MIVLDLRKLPDDPSAFTLSECCELCIFAFNRSPEYYLPIRSDSDPMGLSVRSPDLYWVRFVIQEQLPLENFIYI